MLVNNPMGSRRRRRFYHRAGVVPIPGSLSKEDFTDPTFFNYEYEPFDYPEDDEFQPMSRIAKIEAEDREKAKQEAVQGIAAKPVIVKATDVGVGQTNDQVNEQAKEQVIDQGKAKANDEGIDPAVAHATEQATDQPTDQATDQGAGQSAAQKPVHDSDPGTVRASAANPE